MSTILLKKTLLLLFTVVLVVITINFNSYGQCGVYLKQTVSQRFPYAKVFLDKSADFTGDGVADLLVSQETTSFQRSRMFVIPNNGHGVFGSPTEIDPPASAVFDVQSGPVLIADVNNDSHPDIIATVASPSRSIVAYINNGNGTSFTPLTLGAAGTMGQPEFFVDLNNDGFGDYLGFGSSDFTYSLSNGNGTFQPPVALIQSGGIATPGDFNNDGKIDFINSSKLYLNQGSLTFAVSDVSSFFVGSSVFYVRDLNGDGKADVVTGLPNSNAGFSILTSTGSSFTRADYQISTDQNWQGQVEIGNFGGNSAPDLVYTAQNLNKKAVFTNDGAGNFTRQDSDQRLYNNVFLRRVQGDFDNDGKTDVIQANSGIDNGHVMLSDVTSFTLLKNVCNRPGQPAVADYDGTGNTDFSYWNPSTGDWLSATNRYGSEPTSTQTVNWGLGSLGDIPTPGDFDGDGLSDRAVFRDSNGIWYIRRSSDLVWIQFPFGVTGDKPVAADFDGDSITDIAVFRPSDGNWYIWYLGTQQFAAVHFGSNGDKPMPADFDGDQKADIAVFRPSTGVWYYLKSSNGDFVGVPWGTNGDKPIPADYDGDGKADLAVYRDSVHGAYVLRSFDSSYTFYPFGISGDVLQVGDYDGDFVADLCIYRPSTKAWWSTSANLVMAPAAVFGADNIQPTSSVLRVE